MPERISPTHPRIVEIVLLLMLVLVIFLSGVVVFALLSGGPTEEDIQRDIKVLAEEMRRSQQSNACTDYQNNRAIETALRDIGEQNDLKLGEPRVLPSKDTMDSCHAVGIEIDERGIPLVQGTRPD